MKGEFTEKLIVVMSYLGDVHDAILKGAYEPTETEINFLKVIDADLWEIKERITARNNAKK